MSFNERLEKPKLVSPSYEGVSTSQLRLRINAAVAAAGSDNSNAATILPGFTLVTGADDAKGVILADGLVGDIFYIKVGDGADLKVYPTAGAAINALTATTGALTVVDDVCFALIRYSATQIYTLPLLPS